MLRMFNFVLGIIAVMLVLLGATSSEANRSQMMVIGVSLFVLTFLIHMITQMMGKATR